MQPQESLYPRGYDAKAKCDYHAGAVGHSTKIFRALKFKLQSLIKFEHPKPLVIHHTKCTTSSASSVPKPITVQVLKGFPYKDNKVVPWRYEVKVCVDGSDEKQSKNDSSEATNVTNIAGIGSMIRSCRIYSPSESRTEPSKETNGKEVVRSLDEERKEISDEEACKFLKLIKQSEYTMMDQLNRTLAKISLLSLMLNSEPHRKRASAKRNTPGLSTRKNPEEDELYRGEGDILTTCILAIFHLVLLFVVKKASWYGKLNPLLDLPCRAELSGFHEESGCDKLVEYVCLNAVLVEFSLTRGICKRCLIRIRLNYHEESKFGI
ncbi:hypothetical protein HKD37_09G025005 [Glycine soja]